MPNGDTVTFPLAKWDKVVKFLLSALALAGYGWLIATWALGAEINSKVDAKVAAEATQLRSWVIELKKDADAKHATFTTVQDLENARQLQEARLAAIERQLMEISNRVEYIYRRELERSGRRGGG